MTAQLNTIMPQMERARIRPRMRARELGEDV